MFFGVSSQQKGTIGLIFGWISDTLSREAVLSPTAGCYGVTSIEFEPSTRRGRKKTNRMEVTWKDTPKDMEKRYQSHKMDPY